MQTKNRRETLCQGDKTLEKKSWKEWSVKQGNIKRVWYLGILIKKRFHRGRSDQLYQKSLILQIR